MQAPALTILLLSTVLLGSPSSSLAEAKAGSAGSPPAIALVGGTILDVSNYGRSSGDILDGVVVLRGGTIEAAGPRKSVKIPAGARRIDVAGKYIVPGLADSFGALGKQAHANAYLYMGVTSLVGIEGPRRPDLYLKANPSPRIYPMGIVGYAERGGALVPSTEAELSKEIETAAQHGTKVVMIHYPITPERTAQIVKKAHELGLGTIGELGMTRYDEAILAGVDAFVHTARYSIPIAPPELRQAMAKAPFSQQPNFDFNKLLMSIAPDDPALNQNAKLLATSPVSLIPTLSLSYLDLPDHRNPWQEPAAKIIDPKDISMPANPLTGQRDEDQGTPMGARFAQLAQGLLRVEECYRRAGARYLAGSGTTAFGTIPGVSLHTELELLSRVGLSPRQALAAATSNFGETFHWKTVGQVKAGYNADLLVLNANPLQGIENLKNIHSVILNGEILDRDKLLAEPH
ncbi:MAG TPA: amidohydrolase family protein [Thermoanaerobaculia bacterium]|jgi:hypothetical protein|nr:amidohydrolase family protein [Thermoanaerobaculia bacterium]